MLLLLLINDTSIIKKMYVLQCKTVIMEKNRGYVNSQMIKGFSVD